MAGPGLGSGWSRTSLTRVESRLSLSTYSILRSSSSAWLSVRRRLSSGLVSQPASQPASQSVSLSLAQRLPSRRPSTFASQHHQHSSALCRSLHLLLSLSAAVKWKTRRDETRAVFIAANSTLLTIAVVFAWSARLYCRRFDNNTTFASRRAISLASPAYYLLSFSAPPRDRAAISSAILDLLVSAFQSSCHVLLASRRCALLAGPFLRPTNTEPHPKPDSSVATLLLDSLTTLTATC